MSNYNYKNSLAEILTPGHNEAAARAIAASNFGASADGFEALKASGVVSAVPQENVVVYS